MNDTDNIQPETPQNYRPMIAMRWELGCPLNFPLLVSPKLDGIRCIIRNGQAINVKGKPFKNQELQKWAKQHSEVLEGLEGELCSSSLEKREFVSRLRSADGISDFEFLVYDNLNYAAQPYGIRRMFIVENQNQLPTRARIYPAVMLKDYMELAAYQTVQLSREAEGVVLRDPLAPYLFGTCNKHEPYVQEIRRHLEGEAICIGFTEATELRCRIRDSKRVKRLVSSKKLKSLTCQNADGKTFEVRFDREDPTRKTWWKHRKHLLGKRITFSYQSTDESTMFKLPIFTGFCD